MADPWKEGIPKDRGHLASRTEPSHPGRWTLLRRDAGTWRNSHPHPSPEPCDRARETDGRTDGQTDRCRRTDCRAQDWDRVNEVKDLRRHLLSGSCKCTVRT